MTLGVAAPGLDRIPRQKATVSETALFEGYSRAERRTTTVQCACGDPIVAISLADADVLLAVGSHNKTRRHVAWRAREDIA